MLPRNVFLDLPHAVATVNVLAKFHATSFRKWSGNGSKILEKFPFLEESQWCPGSKVSSLLIKFVSKTFHDLGALLDRNNFKQEGEILLEKFEPSKVLAQLTELTSVSSKFPAVINHGDLWANNLLFQYNGTGLIQNLKFVDFQVSKVGSRILDLSYLIYTSLQLEVLNCHYKISQLLRLYFETFSKEMLDLKNGEKVKGSDLTWDNFIEEWNEYRGYGLTLALLYAPPMLATAEAIPDMETLTENDLELENETNSKFSDFLNSPITLSRVLNLVQNHL